MCLEQSSFCLLGKVGQKSCGSTLMDLRRRLFFYYFLSPAQCRAFCLLCGQRGHLLLTCLFYSCFFTPSGANLITCLDLVNFTTKMGLTPFMSECSMSMMTPNPCRSIKLGCVTWVGITRSPTCRSPSTGHDPRRILTMCSLTRVPSAAVALWRRMALVPLSSSASLMALHNFMQISEGMETNQVARLVTC